MSLLHVEDVLFSEFGRINEKLDKVCDNTNEIKLALSKIDDRIITLEKFKTSVKFWGIRAGVPAIVIVTSLALGLHGKLIGLILQLLG